MQPELPRRPPECDDDKLVGVFHGCLLCRAKCPVRSLLIVSLPPCTCFSPPQSVLTLSHPPQDCTEWGSRPEDRVAGPLSLSGEPPYDACVTVPAAPKSNTWFAHAGPQLAQPGPGGSSGE